MTTRDEILTEASRHCDAVWGYIVRIREGDESALDDGDAYLAGLKAYGPPGMYGVVMQLLEKGTGISWETIRATPLTLRCSCVLIPGHTSPDLTARRIPNPLCDVHKGS